MLKNLSLFFLFLPEHFETGQLFQLTHHVVYFIINPGFSNYDVFSSEKI
jgi:hypothetical protein